MNGNSHKTEADYSVMNTTNLIDLSGNNDKIETGYSVSNTTELTYMKETTYINTEMLCGVI